MATWIALSGCSGPPDTEAEPPPGPTCSDSDGATGALFVELAQAPARVAVVLDCRARVDGMALGLSVMVDPRGGVHLLHRQGPRLARRMLTLPGGLPQGACIVYGWDLARDLWTLTLTAGTKAAPRMAGGRGAIGLTPEAAEAVCAPETSFHHPGLAWCGVHQGCTAALTVAGSGPAVGAQTPVATPGGPVPAGALVPGDLVLTADAGPQPVLRADHLDLPRRGGLAPLRLRAGHFAVRHDVLVGPGQPVLFDGPGVEYLFGTDEVLIAAGDIGDPVTARAERSGPVAAMVRIVLARPLLLQSDGLRFSSAGPGGAADKRLRLRRYEAAALAAARSGGRAVIA